MSRVENKRPQRQHAENAGFADQVTELCEDPYCCVDEFGNCCHGGERICQPRLAPSGKSALEVLPRPSDEHGSLDRRTGTTREDRSGGTTEGVAHEDPA